MTTWPSGLRRVTRNHFSSGGVGSNPAVVVFYPTRPLSLLSAKNGPTQIRTGVLRTRISYAAPTPWDLFFSYYFTLFCLPTFFSRFFSCPHFFILSCPHHPHYTICPLSLPLLYYKKTPPVGLEPTTLRLKAARSTD